MKINDAEKLLGITKANIRFYEKENLLTPPEQKKGTGITPKPTFSD